MNLNFSKTLFLSLWLSRHYSQIRPKEVIHTLVKDFFCRIRMSGSESYRLLDV